MRKSKLPVLVSVAALGLLAAAGARAGEVYWSVGVQVPAATVAVSNAQVVWPAGAVVVADAPSVRYAPAPVGVPVVAYPQPVGVVRPVIVGAPGVHIVPPPAVFAPAPRGVAYVGYPVAQAPVHWHHKRWHRERHWHDRDDHRGRHGWRDRDDDHDDDRGHRGHRDHDHRGR